MYRLCKISILFKNFRMKLPATRSISLVSLVERRRQQKLIFRYKLVNGLVPTYISDLILPSVEEINTYTLRNQNDITVPFCRTEILRTSCIPSSISAWNSLDIELCDSPSMTSFKYQLKKHQNNSKVPTYYRAGNRYISVLHARIRNSCSNLLSDLYINDLSPSPTCSCSSNCSNLLSDLYINDLSPSPTCSCSEEVEDAEHTFFRCSNFRNERETLFRSIRDFHPLNINIFLFGDENLTTDEKTSIFTAVQTFIKDTRRVTD